MGRNSLKINLKFPHSHNFSFPNPFFFWSKEIFSTQIPHFFPLEFIAGMSFVFGFFFFVPFLKIWIFQIFFPKEIQVLKLLEIPGNFWDWGLGVFILDFFFGIEENPQRCCGRKKNPKKIHKSPKKSQIFQPESQAGIPVGASRGSQLLWIPFLNFYFNFLGGYLGSHWDRTIPGIFRIQNFDQECWSPWRIGEVFSIFEVFGKQIPIYFFPLESLGMQQFLGIFISLEYSWFGKCSNSQNPIQEIQIFR